MTPKTCSGYKIWIEDESIIHSPNIYQFLPDAELFLCIYHSEDKIGILCFFLCFFDKSFKFILFILMQALKVVYNVPYL